MSKKKIKNFIVTPLYYINEETVDVFLDLANKDTTLVVFDDLSPVPPIVERYNALLVSLGLPLESFNIRDVAVHDVDPKFFSTLEGIIAEDSAGHESVDIHYFPTQRDKKLVKKWDRLFSDYNVIIYEDFLIKDLGKQWESLKKAFDPHFKGRFIDKWETYMFGLKGRLDNPSVNVVYYGEFQIDSDEDRTFPILIGQRDYTSEETFAPIDFDLDIVDVLSDIRSLDLLNLELEGILTFSSSPKSPASYDVVVKLKDCPSNLQIINDLIHRIRDTRFSKTSNIQLHLPNSTKSYESVWFERLISDTLSEEED